MSRKVEETSDSFSETRVPPVKTTIIFFSYLMQANKLNTE